MKKAIALFFVMVSSLAVAQTTYDSKTLVDTNNTSTSTSTVNTNNTNTNASTSTSTSTVNSTSTNTNNNNNVSTSTNVNTNNNVNSGDQTIRNINSGTMTYNNNNVNTSTSTNVNTNNNINSGDQTVRNVQSGGLNNTNTNVNTSTSVNTNNNVNSGDQTIRNVQSGGTDNKNTNVNTNNSTSTSTNNNVNQNIQSGEMTNRNINETTITQISPPPTAVAPTMMSGGNNDLCTTGTSGAVQTQIFGVSSGGTIRDLNCERLKNAKTLFDMGMKVAAVATLCQDRRVFDAMWNAGTPCPYEGEIGEKAKVAWNENKEKWPQAEEPKSDDFYKKTSFGAAIGVLVFKLLGF